MIFIKNRKFFFSEEEDEIFAFDGDHNVKTITFCLPSVDFKEYSFRLDMEKESGEKGIAYLTKHVQKDCIFLFWKPQNSQLSPGNLRVQIRAFLADDIEVWHSEQTAFYVGESIGASQAYPAVLPSEFTEMEKRIAEMDERIGETFAEGKELYASGEQLLLDGQSLYEQTKFEANRTAANADSAKNSAVNAAAASGEAKKYADETKALLESVEMPKDGVSPSVQAVPMENTNAYRMVKKAYRMSTIRWCDNADSDIDRELSFTAKVEYTVPYASHAWHIQVRRKDGSDVTLLQLGSDGAGNTLVYFKGAKIFQLTSGWHDYSVAWNTQSGAVSIMVDGLSFQGEYDELIMTDAHGLQVTGAWDAAGTMDTISFDTFSLRGDGVLRFSDNFNQTQIGSALPENWYQNDSESQNVREVFLNSDQEIYLLISDANGTRKTGNIRGKDAKLKAGSVTEEILADGAVGMDKLSSEVRALLEQISSLVATEENVQNGEG